MSRVRIAMGKFEYDPNKRLFLEMVGKTVAARAVNNFVIASYAPEKSRKGSSRNSWGPPRLPRFPQEEPQYIETGPPIDGYATWYDRAHCLGCRADLRMRNGDTLDDSIPTLACNILPLNLMVKVTNMENGTYANAKITDTGGFGGDQIADLNIAIANLIRFPLNQGILQIQLTPLERAA